MAVLQSKTQIELIKPFVLVRDNTTTSRVCHGPFPRYLIFDKLGTGLFQSKFGTLFHYLKKEHYWLEIHTFFIQALFQFISFTWFTLKNKISLSRHSTKCLELSRKCRCWCVHQCRVIDFEAYVIDLLIKIIKET